MIEEILKLIGSNEGFFNKLEIAFSIADPNGRVLWSSSKFEEFFLKPHNIYFWQPGLKNKKNIKIYTKEKEYLLNKEKLDYKNNRYYLFYVTQNDQLEDINDYIEESSVKYCFEDIIGESETIKKAIKDAKKVSKTESNVLIIGETGTGKELFAQSIHRESRRRTQKFVGINCAAVPDNLIENIFFGSVKGAYTGALIRKGLFEEAQGGTIFLDEINSMPINLQSKIIRVLQEKKIRRLGGSEEIDIDVRIISAMNKDPIDAIKKDKIREDLYYRLGVVILKIPSLKERKKDIIMLSKYFFNKKIKKARFKEKPVNKLVYDYLETKEWKGNVRELEHTIESAVIMSSEENEINLEHFPKFNRASREIIDATDREECETLKECMEKVEKNRIIYDLEKSDGSITKAAERLGISRQNLYKKMKKYNIEI